LPPYSPELNPAERVFEELRRAVEGRVWGTVEAKVAAVDRLLQDLARSPLAGWVCIRAALSNLPLQPFPATLEGIRMTRLFHKHVTDLLQIRAYAQPRAARQCGDCGQQSIDAIAE